MRVAVKEYAPDMVMNQVPITDSPDAARAAVGKLKATGFRFVYCMVFGSQFHDDILTEAYHQGIAGNGLYNWFFSDSFLGVLDGRSFEPDSVLLKAYRYVMTAQV